MTDFKNSQTYAYLDQLSIEELEALLRASPRGASEDEASSAYYHAIEEVILRREKESPTGRLSDLDASWEEFCTYYATPEDKNALLRPDAHTAHAAAASTSLNRSNKTRPRLRRRFGILAAAVVAVFAMMVAAQASGLDFFGWLGRWTDEVLWFDSGSRDIGKFSPSHSTQTYDAIQASVERCGITDSVVPTWYPDGYELEETNYYENESSKIVFCKFTDEDEGWIHLQITNYENSSQRKVVATEKDSTIKEEYPSNNQLFYIMNNQQTSVATWGANTWCASIEGTITEEEIKSMIDSIGG